MLFKSFTIKQKRWADFVRIVGLAGKWPGPLELLFLIWCHLPLPEIPTKCRDCARILFLKNLLRLFVSGSQLYIHLLWRSCPLQSSTSGVYYCITRKQIFSNVLLMFINIIKNYFNSDNYIMYYYNHNSYYLFVHRLGLTALRQVKCEKLSFPN